MQRHIVLAAALTGVYGCGCSVSVDPTVEARRKPVLQAAIDCDIDLLRRHIGELDESDARGMRALDYAVQNGCRQGVTLLLEAGADPNASAKEYPPLHAAAGKGDIELVRALLDHGARIDQRGTMGSTPLHSGAMSGNVQVVQLLLERGARIGERAERGYTVLHYGARHAAVAAFLIEQGADVNATADDGATPLMWTPEHVIWIPEHGSTSPPNDTAGAVRLFVSKGAEVNARTTSGNTALISAATVGDPNAVGALIEAGADVNARDSNGRTALSWARANQDHMGWTWRIISLLSSELRRERAAYNEVEQQLIKAGGRT